MKRRCLNKLYKSVVSLSTCWQYQHKRVKSCLSWHIRKSNHPLPCNDFWLWTRIEISLYWCSSLPWASRMHWRGSRKQRATISLMKEVATCPPFHFLLLSCSGFCLVPYLPHTIVSNVQGAWCCEDVNILYIKYILYACKTTVVDLKRNVEVSIDSQEDRRACNTHMKKHSNALSQLHARNWYRGGISHCRHCTSATSGILLYGIYTHFTSFYR